MIGRYRILLYIVTFFLPAVVSFSAAGQSSSAISSKFLTTEVSPIVLARADANRIGEARSDVNEIVDNRSTERKKLLTYLKSLKVGDNSAGNRSGAGFYYHLAGAFARLHLYPLAMKCFLKTLPIHNSATVDTSQNGPVDDALLSINSRDDSLVNTGGTMPSNNSPAITYDRIQQIFDDGKKAVAYAMLFHVKQPISGKRRIFVLNNVGHTFITLIKYNADSSYRSISFGFYPKKNNLLSATPLIPSTPSVFKDDSRHEWDEVLGKFISKRKFGKIQELVAKYAGLRYHLNNNNCTDFGLQAAALAGISINETYGTWPLGKGNNPAITGQSILEHHFSDTNNSFDDSIFLDTVIEK